VKVIVIGFKNFEKQVYTRGRSQTDGRHKTPEHKAEPIRHSSLGRSTVMPFE
jgi:hypothetical protein